MKEHERRTRLHPSIEEAIQHRRTAFATDRASILAEEGGGPGSPIISVKAAQALIDAAEKQSPFSRQWHAYLDAGYQLGMCRVEYSYGLGMEVRFSFSRYDNGLQEATIIADLGTLDDNQTTDTIMVKRWAYENLADMRLHGYDVALFAEIWLGKELRNEELPTEPQYTEKRGYVWNSNNGGKKFYFDREAMEKKCPGLGGLGFVPPPKPKAAT